MSEPRGSDASKVVHLAALDHYNGIIEWTESAVNGRHLWTDTDASGNSCYLTDCESLKSGPRKKCSACKIIVHSKCIEQLYRINIKCKPTFWEIHRKGSHESNVHHHWVHRRKQEGKCHHCGKSFRQMLSFQTKDIIAISCSWCKAAYHNKVECFKMQKIDEMCDLGAHANLIVPPSWVVKLPSKRVPSKSEKNPFVIKPSGSAQCKPLLVFIDPKSGGNQGVKIMHKFQWLLNPRQVFDLTMDGGPKLGLELYRTVPNLRILACGGEGTVDWVLSELDKQKITPPPPVAELPLGTGNNLSRVLNWEGGYTDESLSKILTRIDEGSVVHQDRWNMEVTPNEAVPSEIEARGPRAKLAYENALKTGKVKVYRARIMLIGQDRAGKTSLKKSLIGLPFDPEEQSTDGIEVDPSKFDVDVDQVKNWQRADEKLDVSYFVNVLARMVAGELQEIKETHMDSKLQNKSKEVITLKNRDRQMDTKSQDEPQNIESQNKQIWVKRNEKTQQAPFSHQIVIHSESITSQPVIPELKIDAALPPEEFTDLLAQYLKGLKLQTEAAAVEHHMTLDLWDFAGQHLYYASHSVFLSSRALYMLVYNLSKDLRSTAQPCVRQGIHDTDLNNPNHETNLENVLSWLASVSTMCSSKPEMDESKVTKKVLPYLRPPIFIVGTHADEPHQEVKEMELQIQREISGKDYNGHVIRPFFSVDNTQGSSGDGVAALQKRMIEVLKQEPYMGEEVPLRWFNFEKVVHALVAKKTYYLDLKQLLAIIQKVCFIESEDEAATMLNFYHDLGMIVKHHNTVVLQAQWLIEVFKQLITIRSFSDMEPRHSKLWKEMETTGVLNMELVDYVFSKFCQHGLIKDDILDMMEQFGLIVKFTTSPTDEMYFVPCQLKTPPEPLCEMEPSPSDPCPLYLRFLGGFVPHGLFPQLVSRCTRWCCEGGFIRKPPNLFDGAARFFIVKELIHQLIFICKKRFIKIVLKQMEQELKAPLAEAKVKEVAILVRRFLEDTMQNLSHELPWLKNVTYELCVECPYCLKEETTCRNHGEVSCTHEDCKCLLQVPPDGLLSFCPNSLCDKILRLPQQEKWYLIKEIPKEEVQTSPESEEGPLCSTAQLPKGMDHPAVRPGHHPGTDDIYNMTARPRGITLIVNNKLFVGHPEHDLQSTRHGSEEDVREVAALFDALGFDVHTKENLTRLQLLNELDSVACQDHSGYDCFVLWLMSHGKSGMVFCSDGVLLPIQSAQDMLSNCKTLRGKPKLFFIQACRGDEEDEGFAIMTDRPSPIPDPPGHVDPPSDVDNPSASRISPTHADFLYSYATVDGYVSYRRSDLGSRYVRALVDVFRERANRDDLLGILTTVNRKVSEMVMRMPALGSKSDIKNFKQMPEVKHTLRKQLRF